MNNIKHAISEIKLVGFDIDGVMSDGGLIFSDSNVDFESKIFNVKDGFAIKLLQKSNIEIVIITGRKSSCVENRIIKSLGIKKDFLFQEVADKKQCLENLQKKLEISWKNCAFIGDDWIDLPILMRCGFSACPADAHNEVKQRVDYICQNNGGKGAVREFVEIILKNQKTDLYQSILNEYLK